MQGRVSASGTVLVASLIGVALGAAVVGHTLWWPLCGLLTGLALLGVHLRVGSQLLARLLPLASLLAVLAVFQALGQGVDALTLIRAAAVFVLVLAAGQCLPWPVWLVAPWAHRPIPAPVLLLLILRHFVLVLGGLVQRSYTAWRLATPNRYRHSCWIALVWVTAAVFQRSLARAERFYVAQRARGLS